MVGLSEADWGARAMGHSASWPKRLLVEHDYPPDKQPAAIKLVMEQMESMAPRYAAARG